MGGVEVVTGLLKLCGQGLSLGSRVAGGLRRGRARGLLGLLGL